MRKFCSAILGIVAITIISFLGFINIRNVQASGTYPDMVVLLDQSMPTNHQFTAGQRQESVVRFLVAAAAADAVITSMDVKTDDWSAVFKMAIPGDSEYQKPALYNETDGQFLNYEFSNLSWGSATVNLATPLVVHAGETKSIRVDATVKRGVSGKGTFNLTSLVFYNKAGLAIYPAIKSYMGEGFDPAGNQFTVGSDAPQIIPTLSATAHNISSAATVVPGATNVELGSFVLKAQDGLINVKRLWLISDTPNVEDLVTDLYIEGQDGVRYNENGGRLLDSLYRIDSSAPLASYFFEMQGIMAVPAGEARSFKVRGNISPAATGKIRLGLGGASSTDYVNTLKDAIKLGGVWPVFGSPITISGKTFYLNFDNQLADTSGRAAQTVGNSAGIIYGAGVKGQAVKFASESSYAEYSCVNVVDEKKGSVEAMVKFDQAYGEDAAIWHTDNSRYVLYYDKASTNVQRNIIARAGQEYAATGSGPAIYSFDQYFADSSYTGKRDKLALGAWHHLVMTWEGSPSGTVKLYVDGQLASTNKYTSTAPCKTFRVGNNYWPGINWGNGWIDEVKVYPHPLPADEVKTNYQSYGLANSVVEPPQVTPAPVGLEPVSDQPAKVAPEPVNQEPVAPAESASVSDTDRRAQFLSDNNLDPLLAELNTLRNKVREQEVELKHLRALTKGLANVTKETTQSATDFITYGVDANTKKLGEGERASVVYSYKQAFSKLPETESDVADMIKIANGHWPTERNLAAEASAKKAFATVYKRQPNPNNARDGAAVMIMAYGLRQTASNRNLASERVGIKTFVSIFGHVPANISEWNTMQAITYSGAKR